MFNTQSNALSVFAYNGNNVTFKSDNGIMVNATQMAKVFNKRPAEYLRLPSTNQLIKAIVGKSHIAENQLVATERGGTNPSTWLHEDIALDFAQWLSIDFKLWCNDRIKELLTQGVATISNDDEVIAQAMNVLQRRLEASKQQVAQLEEANADLTQAAQALEGACELLQGENRKMAPKAQYTDEVLQSTSTFTLTQVAHSLGMRSVHVLTKVLQERGLMFRQSGQWQPTAKVAGKGYFATRTAKYVKSDNTIGTSLTTVVTEVGRAWLHVLMARINKQEVTAVQPIQQVQPVQILTPQAV